MRTMRVGLPEKRRGRRSGFFPDLLSGRYDRPAGIGSGYVGSSIDLGTFGPVDLCCSGRYARLPPPG